MKLLLLLSIVALGIGLIDARVKDCNTCFGNSNICTRRGCSIDGKREAGEIVVKRAIDEEESEVKREAGRCYCRGRGECTRCDSTGCNYTPSCKEKREVGEIVVKRAIEEEQGETCECDHPNFIPCKACKGGKCYHAFGCVGNKGHDQNGQDIFGNKRSVEEEQNEVPIYAAKDFCKCSGRFNCYQCDERGCKHVPWCRGGKREAGEIVVKRAIEEETAEAMPLFKCECDFHYGSPCHACVGATCKKVKECIGNRGYDEDGKEVFSKKRAIEEEKAETRRVKRACGVEYTTPGVPPRCYSWRALGYYHYVPCEECKNY